MVRPVEGDSFLKPVVGTAQIGIVGILLKGGKLAEAETYLTKVKERAFHPLSMEIACLYNELELRLLQGDREGARAVATELKQRDVLRSPMYRAPVVRYLLFLDMADEAEVAGFRYEHIDTPHWHDDLLHARLLAREDRGEEALAFIDERLGRLRQQQAKLPLVETLLVKTHILVGDGSVPLPEDGEQSARNALREAIHYSYENRLFAPFLLMAGPEQDMVRALRHDAGAEFNTAEHQFLDELTSRWEPDG